jgi:thioredoxin 1
LPKLIKLYQPSCVPCQMVSNFLDSQNVKYESINVLDNPDIASKYEIMSTPVTILLDDDGKEIKRSVGFKPDELEELLNNLQ